MQAENGIRHHCVTGVQTCALPIYLGKNNAMANTRGLPWKTDEPAPPPKTYTSPLAGRPFGVKPATIDDLPGRPGPGTSPGTSAHPGGLRVNNSKGSSTLTTVGPRRDAPHTGQPRTSGTHTKTDSRPATKPDTSTTGTTRTTDSGPATKPRASATAPATTADTSTTGNTGNTDS